MVIIIAVLAITYYKVLVLKEAPVFDVCCDNTSMNLKKSLFILAICGIFLASELYLYGVLGMRRALSASGLSAAVAYKFLWLTVFTVTIGLTAPVSALFSLGRSREFNFSLWGILVGIFMISFTALSFWNTRRQEILSTPFGAVETLTDKVSPKPFVLTPPAPSGPQKISETVQLVDFKTLYSEPSKISAEIRFKNISNKIITEMDYAISFTASDGEGLLYTPLRESVLVPPGITGTSRLFWNQEVFPDRRKFEKLKEALSSDTLKKSVTFEKAQFSDLTRTEA